MKTAFCRIVGSVCLLSFGLITQMWGLSYKYSNIQVPESSATSPTGINNNGEIVGYYETSAGEVYSFVLSDGDFTTISCPGEITGTFAYGINDNGVLVGYYGEDHKNFGFVYENGECKKLAEFKDSVVYPTGIDNKGTIVGYYFEGNINQGFELEDGKYKEITVPNSSQTIPWGINQAGDISGAYYDASGNEHGFLLHNGTYQTIDYPGAPEASSARALNESEIVVGSYKNPSTHVYNGFLLQAGKFMRIMVPGSVTTFPVDVNNSDVIVGYYFDGTVNPQGFMATPAAK